VCSQGDAVACLKRIFEVFPIRRRVKRKPPRNGIEGSRSMEYVLFHAATVPAGIEVIPIPLRIFLAAAATI